MIEGKLKQKYEILYIFVMYYVESQEKIKLCFIHFDFSIC